jgi:ATP-binding cassette subfamily B protein
MVVQPLVLFIGLIALENTLWRLGGWLGCRTVVAVGVQVRLDLFAYLPGHSVRFFSNHLAGALGNRITATAGAVGSLFGTLTWSIVPPCTEFIGAVIVFITVDWHIAVALTAFVVLTAATILAIGERGRPLHHAYADHAADVGGELVDVVSNMWTVKAFSARVREYQRLAAKFHTEARAQRSSWLHLEKTRLVHDLLLWLMASGMLT